MMANDMKYIISKDDGAIFKGTSAEMMACIFAV